MDKMTCINTKHLAEKVKKAFEVCANNVTCEGCPYHFENQCRMEIHNDAVTVINGYQEQLDYVVEANEKNVGKALSAQFESDTWKMYTKSLEEDIRALKENNARLAEQNKNLLAKEIENTRLRNENQSLRDENKDLDERNDKLVNELRYCDSKMRNLLEEIDRQNKVKIEVVDLNIHKLGKAADKAAKALAKAVKNLNKFNRAYHIPTVDDQACLSSCEYPSNTPSQYMAMPGDVFAIDTPHGVFYRAVKFADTNGIYLNNRSIYSRNIIELFRKDENGNLKLIWKK